MKFSRDYILTFATEFTVLIAGILVYKFAANVLGHDGFSEYTLCRRTISFIQPLMILGLGVGMPRYIAFATADSTMKKAGSYFISSFIIIALFSIVALLIMFLAKQFASYVIFGDEKFSALIPPLEILLAGGIMHSMCYSYFRGKIKMVHANVLQIINLGIIPLVVFLFCRTMEGVLMVTGLALLSTSFVAFMYILSIEPFSKNEIIKSSKELLRYGIQRVPGDVALGGFLALPAYIAAHLIHDDLKTAGYIAFAMSLLNMAGAAFGPICLILLPEASRIIVNKDFHLLKQQVKKITVLTLSLTLTGVVIVEIFASPFIKIYLGSVFTDSVFCMRITMLASIGYTIYISLRSILDAYYVKAVNTRNIFISFLSFLGGLVVLWLTGFKYEFMLYIFIFSFSLLGILTYIETRKIINSHNL